MNATVAPMTRAPAYQITVSSTKPTPPIGQISEMRGSTSRLLRAT